jgi:regulator of sirC expression with transglutaminase-like and TPR domain
MMMPTQIDTTIDNKPVSQKLKEMLADLVNNAEAVFDSVKEIREQARSEGFKEFETDLLSKIYLERGLGRDKARYILHDNLEERNRKVLLTIWQRIAKMTITIFQIYQHLIIIL